MTDAFRVVEEEKGRAFAELEAYWAEVYAPLFAALREALLEHEREEIVESIPWGD